ncbi:manganese-dependent ADP-ribose/CDP-alcohol diphosphatase isoform X1 [Pipra filicauda]|uniref:Manganese-dependent ADP-ribose/CDP-alcohol diphosphatase isoform X1 n=1 Tax=Pipra filicauda TaxID=649802 RepID=A0A7R5KTW2_9PASS|nr:manganese-dependent ADP-ribose/CDP-alcohol diphosphatase isoform X1 [Pipra filicauda]
MEAVPRVAFGVIADIQFADADDGHDFGGSRRRYYRHSLRLLRDAVRAWAAESPPIDFVLQLGDSIDGLNARRGEAEGALRQVLEALGRLPVPVHHAWGNHEFYNFSRTRLAQSGLCSRPAGGAAGPPDGLCQAYHCSPAARLRLVVLDAYDLSVLGRDPDSPRYEESLRLLREKNTNEDLNSPAGHLPIHPDASDRVCLAWNYEAALSVIHSHRCVVCVLAGHLHDGGYCLDSHGVHHLTLEGVIETPPESNAFGTIYVYEDKMILKGRGRIADRVMQF